MKRLACAAALALAVTSCGGDDADYSYFAVDITLDRATIDDDFVKTIVGCTMFVYWTAGAGDPAMMIDNGDLQCARGTIRHDFGRADWSTRKSMGAVKFVVTMHDFANQVVASGTSAVETIVAKGEVTTTVVVTAPIPKMTPDGGPVDGGSPDNRADPSAGTRPDGATADGGTDTLGILDGSGN